MSNLKINTDLFLEKQELNRFKRFLVDDGMKQQFILNSTKFGIVKGFNLPNGTNTLASNSFKVDNIGAGLNTVNIRSGRAVDKFGNILTLDVDTTQLIPATGDWYWIIIKYETTNNEVGTVTIDASGNLTGSGTFFTEVLRGQPNFPAKIRFTNSVGNVYDYEVVDVISDTSAILVGDFTAESNLTYGVVGTFTAGYVPPTNDKMIFEYDSVNIRIEIQDPFSVVPPTLLADEEFFLAQARVVGLNVEIQDKRTAFWETRAEAEIHSIDRLTNPIIGVESVKWDIATTTRERNEINIAWGFRSTNWSLDTTQNLITISSGLGGILKENDVTFFVNGMFDGWRLYTKSGKYYRVTSSTKSGIQLNIKLDFLDFSEFGVGDELHIVPDVEEIEIRTNYDDVDGINNIIEEKFTFPIHYSTGKIYVRITDAVNPYLYNLTYRYKNIHEFIDWQVFPNDTIGFYDESSFEANGVLKANPIDRTQKPYNGNIANGFIEIVPNPNNINIVFQNIITGDKFGLDHKTLTNSTPVWDLVVGTDRQTQVFEAPSLTLAAPMFINLTKFRSDATPCINGNIFIIQIEGELILGGQPFRIVTDYVNPTTYTLIREIEQIDVNFIKQNQQKKRSGLTMIFTYDGTEWWLSISNEMNGVPKNTIVDYAGSLLDFNGSGLGIADEVLGWAICNGNNGTKDLRGKVLLAYDDTQVDYTTPFVTGGNDKVTLIQTDIPEHIHSLTADGFADNVLIQPQFSQPSIATSHNFISPINGSLDTGGTQSSISEQTLELQSFNHSHTLSGVTGNGPSMGPQTQVDVRQKYFVSIKIQKII